MIWRTGKLLKLFADERLSFTGTPPRRRVGRGDSRVSSEERQGEPTPCCCNVKMSSPNCSVKRSSLNGDLHVEPEGTASARAVKLNPRRWAPRRPLGLLLIGALDRFSALD